MSIGYRLTLAGVIPLEDVAALAACGAAEGRTRSGARMLTDARYDDLGYVVDITAGTDGYYEADNDGEVAWVWEPDTWVDVNFHMRKDTLSEMGTPNMLTAVARVLAGRHEDAALVFDGNVLLLTRIDGVLRTHNMAGWYHEGYGAILPST